MSDATYILDTKRRIVDINHAARQLSAQQTVGQNIDVICPQIAEMILLSSGDKIIAEGMAYGDSVSGQSAARSDEGRRCIEIPQGGANARYFEITIKPVTDQAASLYGWLVILHDVSEQKQAEATLREAKEKAELAAQVKGEFLANMSHELRTPLNAVLGMSSMLLATPLSNEQRESIETIQQEGDALLTIINNILDYSKLEAITIELETEPFDLVKCIEESMALFAHQAAKKKLVLTYSLAETAPRTIIGDRARLRQVLANLLSNAVKFTERGSVTINVATQSKHLLHFQIQDTGIGIPPDRMNRLFHSFSQIDASTTRRYGGTGLGLAISKRVVELMGGTIWAESMLGAGSTFHFTLPALIAAKPMAAAPDASTQPAQSPSNSTPQELRILLAEDNMVNQKVALRLLERCGYKSAIAANGREVLDALEQDDYDVILMDVQMPEMSGLEATRRIRQRYPAERQPYIIAMTANVTPGDEAECLAAGMNAYIGKPVHLEELAAALKRVHPKSI
jgi:signal transduction histidine kinase/CheY-like chemotaxis protein